MYRKLQYRTRLGILSTIIVTLMVVSSLGVSGDFSEDFSSPSEEWMYFAHTNSRDNASHTWDLSGEQLKAAGASNDDVYMYACHPMEIGSISWTFRSNGSIGFRITQMPAQDSYVADLPAFQVVIRDVNLFLGQHDLSNSIFWTTLQTVENTQPDEWLTYSIERNNLDITVYRESSLIMSGTLNEDWVVDYDGICIWAKPGTNATIDDIQIDSNSTIPDTKISDTSKSDSQKTFFLDPFIVIPLGIAMAATFSVMTGSYIKKKGLEE